VIAGDGANCATAGRAAAGYGGQRAGAQGRAI